MPVDDTTSTGVDRASPPDTSGAQISPAGWTANIRNWVVILGLALLAGVASWLWGEALLDHFKPSEKAAAQRVLVRCT